MFNKTKTQSRELKGLIEVETTERLETLSSGEKQREIANHYEMKVVLGAAQRRRDMAESSLETWAVDLRKKQANVNRNPQKH